MTSQLTPAAPPAKRVRTPDEERLHRKQRLAATLRLFARYGFDEGAGGHITARDPERTDRFWVNPFGVHFGTIRVSDLLLVDHDGTVVDGDGRVNPAAFAIHSADPRGPSRCRRRGAHPLDPRPGLVAARAARSTRSRRTRARSSRTTPSSTTTPAWCWTPTRARGSPPRSATHKAVILRNHGLLTVGGSVEEAAWWFIAMDRCCQVQLLAEAAGEPVPIDAGRRARTTRDDDRHARSSAG